MRKVGEATSPPLQVPKRMTECSSFQEIVVFGGASDEAIRGIGHGNLEKLGF